MASTVLRAEQTLKMLILPKKLLQSLRNSLEVVSDAVWRAEGGEANKWKMLLEATISGYGQPLLLQLPVPHPEL